MTADMRWLPVVGFEGRYEVSDSGLIRSPRGVLSQSTNRGGYRCVTLRSTAGKKTVRVHIVVLAAFVGPRPSGKVTRHLDGNSTNNALTNLTYGTQSENILDASRHGTHHQVVKTHCPSGHPYDEANTYRVPSRPRQRRCLACHRGGYGIPVLADEAEAA